MQLSFFLQSMKFLRVLNLNLSMKENILNQEGIQIEGENLKEYFFILDSGVKFLSNSLNSSSLKILELDLSWNLISRKAICNLIENISKISTLQKLKFSGLKQIKDCSESPLQLINLTRLFKRKISLKFD